VTPFATGRPAASLDRAPGLVEDESCLLQESGPSVGQADRSRLAIEEIGADLVFEGANLSAQWRLRDAKPLRSQTEMTLLGYGDEVPQVP
jgi:heme oxygenase